MKCLLFFVAIFSAFTSFLHISTAEAITRDSFNYAILISKQSANDPKWNEVATLLEKKYATTKIFTYANLDELVDSLTKFSPDYIAFVCKPEEASPEFVKQAGRLNRKLENKPYGTAVWAIVTGYSHEDALRIAKDSTPPKINFGLGGMLGFIDALPEGVAFSEFIDKKNEWQEKRKGLKVKSRNDAPDDHMIPMIKLINSNKVDGVWTSGHSGNNSWSVYYPEGPAEILAENGALSGLLKGEPMASIKSGNPKIYLGIGNCLTARIDDPNASYALSWLHSGGANQYFGYIVETYYGMMGWRTADNFFYRGARFNVAESMFVANQSLLLAMNKRLVPGELKDMEYDRDATVVYGDPAWMATVPDSTAKSAEHWSTQLDKSIAGNKIRWELTVRFKKESNFSPESGRDLNPVFVFLPERIKKGKASGKLSNVSAYHIANNFVIVNFRGKIAAGETRKFIFDSDIR